MDTTSIITRYQEIGRERALTDDESLELEKAIRREGPAGLYRKWTMDESRDLAKAAKVRGGLKAYAEATGRSYASCQTQLAKVKQQRRRRGIAFVGRFFYDGEIGGE
jgi:hypothetical protein